jgi:hypothetical protein
MNQEEAAKERELWAAQLAAGQITQEEYDDLVKGQEDLEEMKKGGE